MITVAGEALLDILLDPAGGVSVHPGGAPLNVARTIARLGGECRFLGRLSDDPLGGLLLSSLRADGIGLVVPQPVRLASTIAVAALDASGNADYRFYLEGTSAGMLTVQDIPPALFGDTDALVLGGLGLLVEPMASTLMHVLSRLADDALVVLDPNCRARAIGDGAAHRRVIGRVSERADVVKVSAQDIAQLAPGTEIGPAARALLARGPKAVLVTDGPAPVAVHCAAGEVHVPVPSVRVADTVGSGDAFVGAFTAWWRGSSLPPADLRDMRLLQRAVEAAVQVAALSCTRAGAQPPTIPRWLCEDR